MIADLSYIVFVSILSTIMVGFILLMFFPIKQNSKQWISFFVAIFIAALMQMSAPVAYRLSLLFITTLVIGMHFLKLNINQSFWLTTLLIFFIMIADGLSTFVLLRSIRTIYDLTSRGHEAFIHMILNLFVLSIMIFPFRKTVRKFLEKRLLLSKTQIIMPITVIFILILLTLFLVLNTENNSFVGSSPVLALALLFAFIALGGSVSFFSIQYLIKINEMKKLEQKVTHLESSIRVAKGNSAFEKSIEFDLTQTEKGLKVSSDYTLETLIYNGKNSQIYRIKNKATLQEYTLKAIEKAPDIEYDFKQLVLIKHPRIIGVQDFFEGKHYHYVLKPYINGKTLFEEVKTNGPLKESEVINIALQLVQPLKYLHSRKEPIVFRDLKPSNIILDEKRQVFLIDLESVRRKRTHAESDTFVVGTKGYASPEQYGYSQSTPKSDIYALGATLYFLLMGDAPDAQKIYKFDNYFEKWTYSTMMLELVKKCLKFDPEDRFNSVDEIESFITKNV